MRAKQKNPKHVNFWWSARTGLRHPQSHTVEHSFENIGDTVEYNYWTGFFTSRTVFSITQQGWGKFSSLECGGDQFSLKTPYVAKLPWILAKHEVDNEGLDLLDT